MDANWKESEGEKAQLGLCDVTSIIVGIIVGVGIFRTPQLIFEHAPGPWESLGIWLLGGILALVGALCFAELAATYPRSGGEYVYLTRAFGPLVGFLFAWAQLAVIRPASIATMAYIVADEAQAFVPALPSLSVAIGAVLILSAINIVGVTCGTVTQNLLTGAKIFGLAAIVIVGLFFSDVQIPPLAPKPASKAWFASAMILVLWTYSGWHEAAYVAAEVKDSRRNLPLSLILGTLAVTFIYLLVNSAILLALGFEEARIKSPVDIFRSGGGKSINLVIMVSALGALNGMVFTTSRIFSAFGADHRLFAPLGHWSRRLGTPARALSIQCILALGYLLLGAVSELFRRLFTDTKPLNDFFDVLTAEQSLRDLSNWIDLTAAVFWCFFLLTGAALIVLRVREPELPRPFRVPLYPVLPLVFCGWCGYMVYGAVETSPHDALFGFVVVLAGLPLYFLPQKKKHQRQGTPASPLVGAGR